MAKFSFVAEEPLSFTKKFYQVKLVIILWLLKITQGTAAK